MSYERQPVDSRSPDSVLRAIDYMQQFITQAKHTTGHDHQPTQQATDNKEKEEKKEDEQADEKREEEELEEEEKVEVSDDEQELRQIMNELANRPELLRWAAEEDALEEEKDDKQHELRESAAPSRLLPLAARMREESELFASRRRPLLSSSSLDPSLSSASPHSPFSLLSAAERRLCSLRLSSLQRQLADEARQRRSTEHTLRASMAVAERKRRAELKRVESAAVERAMAAAMGRNRREERVLEKMVAEQADRVRQLLQVKMDGMRSYYREQLGLVQEESHRQDEERSVQQKVRGNG